MFRVLAGAWALLLGMGLLMAGNGMQGTLLGIRGDIEGFSTAEMSIVMSAYFLGFPGGSRAAPRMIQRVGHARAFAALVAYVACHAGAGAPIPVDETTAYVVMSQATATPAAMDLAQGLAIEASLDDGDDGRVV